MGRLFLAVLIVVSALVAVEYFATGSVMQQAWGCAGGAVHDAASPGLLAPFSFVVDRGCRSTLWLGRFVHDQHEAIETLGFLAMALFAGALWVSTRKLWLSSEQQIKLLQSSAEAAKSAADVAAESLYMLERAFVHFHDAQLLTPGPQEDGRCLIQIRAVNSGRSPTQHAIGHLSWQIFDERIGDDFDFPDQGEWPHRVAIGPTGTALLGPQVVPSIQAGEILQGRRHLYVWGWLEYDDVFADTPRHRSEFCQEMLVGMTSTSAGGRPAIHFRPHASHNGADEDCIKPIQTGSPKNPLVDE